MHTGDEKETWGIRNYLDINFAECTPIRNSDWLKNFMEEGASRGSGQQSGLSTGQRLVSVDIIDLGLLKI